MYRSRELEKQDELRNAIKATEYKDQVAEKSFDDLLVNNAEIVKEESAMTMPSATTLEYVAYKGDNVQEVEEIIIPKEKYSISARGKVLIAVYAFIVLAIFAVIIFNATYLRGLDRKIDKAQTEVATVQAIVNEKALVLEDVSSAETIAEKAIELGMELR